MCIKEHFALMPEWKTVPTSRWYYYVHRGGTHQYNVLMEFIHIFMYQTYGNASKLLSKLSFLYSRRKILYKY